MDWEESNFRLIDFMFKMLTSVNKDEWYNAQYRFQRYFIGDKVFTDSCMLTSSSNGGKVLSGVITSKEIFFNLYYGRYCHLLTEYI